MMKVIELPPSGVCIENEEFATYLRTLANEIEKGAWGNLRTMAIVQETHNGAIERHVLGKHCDNARFIGLLTYATHRVMTGEMN